MTKLRSPAFFQEAIADFYRRRIEPHGKNIFWTKNPGPGALNLKDNDYLLLAGDERLNRAQADDLLEQGSGLQMSGVYLRPGTSDPRARLERELAAFLGLGGATLCQSGYEANAGLMQVLLSSHVRNRPTIFLDQYAHMSFHAGIQGAHGRSYLFRHNDPASLERLVRARAKNGGVIVVDSLYSTMGTFAPLIAVSEIARNYDCLLVVDESHSLGLFGPDGSGICALEKVKPDFITASLAKAFGFGGGFVAFREPQVDGFFRYVSLPAIFSSVMSPHTAVRGLETLKIIREEEWRREVVRERSRELRRGMRELGYDIGEAGAQIMPLVLGSEASAARARDLLEEKNIFTALFVPPATPKDGCLTRLTVNCGISAEDVEYALSVFARFPKDLRPTQGRSASARPRQRAVLNSSQRRPAAAEGRKE